MISNKTYVTQDLVLNVKKSYDPTKIKLNDWDRFINILCGDRFYQKDAIKTSVIYLASGNYSTIEDLVRENLQTNSNLAARYHSHEEYKKKIPTHNHKPQLGPQHVITMTKCGKMEFGTHRFDAKYCILL